MSSEQQGESRKETFGDFDLSRALEYLNLFPYQIWDLLFSPVQPSEALKVNLRRTERQVTIGSNEWEQRLFMELIFLETVDRYNIRMWQEKTIDAGQSPFRGKVDFVFTPYQASFKLPYLIVAAAKKEDFEQGWGQCLMAMKAAQLLSTEAGETLDIYGIVSSGKIWEFGKYSADDQFYKTDPYTLNQLDVLLGLIHSIFAACDGSNGLSTESEKN